MRSFRLQLAARFALTMALGLAVIAVLGYAAMRAALDREINSTLLNLASIQAASVTESPSGAMAFHEWELTPEEAASVRDLNRYAQVWTGDGRSLVRSRQLTGDLPLDTAALAVAARGSVAWTEKRFGALPIRSVYYPLGRLGPAHEQHVLQVAAPLSARNDLLRSALAFLVALVTCAGAGTFAGAWWLAEQAIRPVHDVIDRAEAIRPGIHGRIDAHAGTREYQRLVQVLNRMLERLEAGFEAQRRFTADASHELRSPLTALRGELELARRRERTPDEYRRVLDSALEEVERLCRVADDLLTLARSDAGVIEPRFRSADLAGEVGRTVERLRGAAEARGVALDLHAPATVPTQCDPDLLGRLVWNLVENAIKFTPAGGRVDVSLEATGEAVTLTVADTGPGIAAEHLPRLFERFYRGDAARTPGSETHGTGLGLSIVRAIAELHAGRVAAESRPGGGTLFRAILPRNPARAAADPAGGPAS